MSLPAHTLYNVQPPCVADRNAGSEAGAEAFLTVDVAARILGKTARHIRRMCASGALAARQADGQWLVDPACSAALRLATGTVAPLALAEGGRLAGLSAAQRDGIRARMEIVEAYQSSLDDRPAEYSRQRWMDLWIEAWNIEHPRQRLSRTSLYKYLAAYQAGGVEALVDRRADNGGEPMTDPRVREFVLGLWLDQNRPTLPRIYELACVYAKREGLAIASESAIRKMLARTDRKLALAGREPKKFRDRCIPYIERDWTQIPAGGCIVGDHHQFDILWPRLTYNRAKRRTEWGWYRPWLSAWLDARTWYPWGAAIAFDSPDGDRVMGSFLAGVMAHGAPEHVYLDNGKDYRMYRFAGGRRVPAGRAEKIVSQAHVKPVLELLGIDVTWAIPFNAKAKPVEVWFGVVEGHFGKRFETYCGNKPERRPERLKPLYRKAEQYAAKILGDDAMQRLASIAAQGDQDIRDAICLEPLKAAFAAWLRDDYILRPSPCKGAAGLSPARAFEALRPADMPVRRVAEQDLALLLMPSQAVAVRQSGIWVKTFGRFYWSPDLEQLRCNGHRSKIVYRFNPDDSRKIYVFDANGDRFLAVATPYIGGGMHPLAAHGSDDAQQLSDAMALQRSIAKRINGQVRESRRFAATALLGAQREAAGELGLLDSPADIERIAPARSTVITLAGHLTDASAAGRRHDVAARDAEHTRRLAASIQQPDVAERTDSAEHSRSTVSAFDLLTTTPGMDAPTDPIEEHPCERPSKF